MKLLFARRGLLSIMAVLSLQGTASAQTADAALLDMREAFRRNNAPALSALLPRVRGHQLEPMARYWEARARLETASPSELRDAMDRMAGT